MTMPQTVKGWVQLAAAIVALVGSLIAGGWTFVQSNAWAYQLAEVEQYAAEGIKSATCNSLRLQIKTLEREKVTNPDRWTGSDEAYLQDMIRRWRELCVGG